MDGYGDIFGPSAGNEYNVTADLRKSNNGLRKSGFMGS
jgi:hypothetical protein